MSLLYQEITDALTPELVESLLYKLGAQEVIKKEPDFHKSGSFNFVGIPTINHILLKL